MNIKKNNNLTYFKKKFKKLEKTIILKNLRLSLVKKDYDVMVFSVFNFYNSVNISIFKDILEQNNIKYYYVKSNDYKLFLQNNNIFNFWRFFITSGWHISFCKIIKLYILRKQFPFQHKFTNLLNIWQSSFHKNFNIILLVNFKEINNNVLETLKIYAKVDPLYLKFKSHKKLMSYNFLTNNLLQNYKSLKNYKISISNLMFHNQIKVLKILKLKNNF